MATSSSAAFFTVGPPDPTVQRGPCGGRTNSAIGQRLCTGRRHRARTKLSDMRRFRVRQRAKALPTERDCPANAAPIAPIGGTRGASAPLSAPAARRPGGLGLGRHRGEHLGHVGVDQLLTDRSGYRYPMVTVANEMPMAHAVDLDRRDRLTAPLGQRQPLPAEPDPARGGPEAAVEVTPRAGGAHDRVEPDCLQPQLRWPRQPSEPTISSSGTRRPLSTGRPRRRFVSAARNWCRLARRKSFSASARGNPVSSIGAPSFLCVAQGQRTVPAAPMAGAG